MEQLIATLLFSCRKLEIQMLRILAWRKMLTENHSWKRPTGIWTSSLGLFQLETLDSLLALLLERS